MTSYNVSCATMFMPSCDTKSLPSCDTIFKPDGTKTAVNVCCIAGIAKYAGLLYSSVPFVKFTAGELSQWLNL